MLSLNQTFEESRPIRVLVVPIGNNSLFETHFDIVSRRRDIPMFDLNRPSDWKQQSCPFKNFNWNSGSVLFEYLRYDRGTNGPSDLDFFQASRRVLVVIGVINFPEFNIESLDVDMDYYSRRYPHVILRRYFIFNYAFDATSSRMPPLPSKHDDPYAVVVFPPDGLCEGGSMIDVHMREVIATMSVRLFLALEVQMTVCDDVRQKSSNAMPSHLILATKYDDLDKEAATESKRKKRLPGRLRKWMGDLCLQVCSPLDALEHYAVAMSECRSYNDYMWLAGSLEGFCTSVLLMLKLQIPFEEVLARDLKPYIASGMSADAAVLKLVEDRGVEALTMYSKCVALCGLEVEGTLRIARMLETASIPDKEQKVLEFIMRAASIPGLNNQQQFETILEGSFICSRLGLKRKYAFLLYVAAVLSAECENTEVAHSLARCACKQYGVSFGDPWNPDAPDMHVASPHLSWANMRRVLFAHSANFAKENGDITEASKAIAALLRITGEMESRRLKYRKLWIPAIFPGSSEVMDSLVQGSSSPAVSSSDISPDIDSSLALSSTKSLRIIPGTLEEFDVKRSMTMDRPQSDSAMRLLGSKSAKSVSSPTSDLSIRMLSEDMRGSSLNRALNTLHQSAATAKSQLAASLTTMSESHHSRDSDSQHVDANGEANRALIDVLKGSRGLISVPKLVPFVSGLATLSLIKKRHRSIKQVPIPVSTTAFERELMYPPNYGNIAISGSAAVQSYRPLLAMSVNDTQGVLSGDGVLLLQDPTNRLGVCVEEQEQTMTVLNAFSKLLEPGTPLLMTGLPKLVACKCLPLPEMQRPYALLRGDGSGGAAMAAKGALFYDPFASKRSKNAAAQEMKHFWMVDALSSIEVVFANPLAIPLVLQDVRVLIEGAAHKITPMATLVIPPYTTDFSTMLHVIPLAVGDMKVAGVRFVINNATHDIAIDSGGNAVSPVPSEITPIWSYPRKAKASPKESKHVTESIVTTALATLQVDTSWMSLEHLADNSAVKTLGMLPGASLNMFAGEVKREWIRIENISEKKVADIRVAAQLYSQDGEKKKLIASANMRPFSLSSPVPANVAVDNFATILNSEDLASKFPLAPGGNVVLEVQITCPATSYSAQIANQSCSALLQLDIDYLSLDSVVLNGNAAGRMSPPSPYDDGKGGDIELRFRQSSEQAPASSDTLYYKKSVIRSQVNVYPSVRFSNLVVSPPVSQSHNNMLSSAAMKPMLERYLSYREVLEIIHFLPTSTSRLLSMQVWNDSDTEVLIHHNNTPVDFSHISPALSDGCIILGAGRCVNIVARIDASLLLSKLTQTSVLTEFVIRDVLGLSWATSDEKRKGVIPLAMEMMPDNAKKCLLSTSEQAAAAAANYFDLAFLSSLISPIDMQLSFCDKRQVVWQQISGTDMPSVDNCLQQGVFYNLRVTFASTIERLRLNKLHSETGINSLEAKVAVFTYAEMMRKMKIDSVDIVPCDSVVVTGRRTAVCEMRSTDSRLEAEHCLAICFPCTGMFVVAVMVRFLNQEVGPWWTFGAPTVVTVK